MWHIRFYDELNQQSSPAHPFSSKPYILDEFGRHDTQQAFAYSWYQDAKTALDAGTVPNLFAYVVWDSCRDADIRTNHSSGVCTGAPDLVEQQHFNRFGWGLGSWLLPTPESRERLGDHRLVAAAKRSVQGVEFGVSTNEVLHHALEAEPLESQKIRYPAINLPLPEEHLTSKRLHVDQTEMGIATRNETSIGKGGDVFGKWLGKRSLGSDHRKEDE